MKSSFRSFDDAPKHVMEHYRNQYQYLTLNIAREHATFENFMDSKHCTPRHLKELLGICAEMTDLSDPDFGKGQDLHAFQAASCAAKKVESEGAPSWFPLAALIHDIGKTVNITRGWPQWSLVGDSYPLDVAPVTSVLPFGDEYKSKFPLVSGIYPEKGCGFSSLTWAGHDEVGYRALKRSTSLPWEALYVIRFHSFYAWHRDGAYMNYASDEDIRMLDMLQSFSNCDLYSKDDVVVDDTLPTYDDYADLIESYIPDGLIYI